MIDKKDLSDAEKVLTIIARAWERGDNKRGADFYGFRLKKMVMEKKEWKIDLEFFHDLPDIAMYYTLRFEPNIKSFYNDLDSLDELEAKQPDMFGEYEKRREKVKLELDKFIVANPAFKTNTAEVWESKKTEDGTLVIKFKVEDKLVYELSNRRYDLKDNYLIELTSL
jgi:hypothetical protein